MLEEVADNEIAVLLVEFALFGSEAALVGGELELLLLAQLGFKLVQSLHMT
jgi:hypothetical protein